MLCQEQESLLFLNRLAAFYDNIALNPAGQIVTCCVPLIFLPDKLADTCWKAARAPGSVPHVTTEHRNNTGFMNSLISLGSAVALFVSCVEGELQSLASPKFTL